MKFVKNLVYQTLEFSGAFQLVSRLYEGNVLILCYHGGSLGDEWTFNPKLFMRSQTFRSRIKNLVQRRYHFISLDDLFSMRLEDIPAKAVCITFDDGWQSTFSELLPTLAEYEIPSTLYLHTEKFVDQMPVHNVAIRYLAAMATQFKVTAKDGMPWGEGLYDFQLPKDVNRFILDMNSWIANQKASKSQIYSTLRHVALVLRARGDGSQFNDKRFEYISPEQICHLEGLNCKVELHGHRHSYPAGNPLAFGIDLRDCRQSILSVGLANPRHYCYPSGSHDLHASNVLREHGVVSATTCEAGFVNAKRLASPHYLPRFLDGEDVSDIEFRSEISGIADIFRRMRN